MKNIRIIFLLMCLNVILVTSCSDYLDIVPDNITSVNDAFSSRSNAERFRNTCYGYLPSVIRPFHDPNWIASQSDEFWFYPLNDYPSLGQGDTPHGLAIMQGGQNTDQPYIDYWDGSNGGVPLFRALRECNIFLENIENPEVVPDLSSFERLWWIGEVKFLKAYYHFYLMHLYGPIPIIRENLPMNASPEEVRIFRDPVEDVVEYAVELLDESVEYLNHDSVKSDYRVANDYWNYGGRITASIAKAVKAKVLVWAASRLFNGNEYYARFTNFTDTEGNPLIPVGAPDLNKWKRAADACLDAIQTAETLGGHRLYTSRDLSIRSDVSPTTEQKYVLRYAITDPFNREIVWPSTHPFDGFGGWGAGIQTARNQFYLVRESIPSFQPPTQGIHNGSMGTTLQMAEQFYTSNGLPIEDDADWQNRIGGYESRYKTRLAEGDDYHKYYIKQGRTTAQLHFFREPRFYAYVGFDGSIWEGVGQSEENSFVVNKTASTMTGNVVTGYYMKKIVHPEANFTLSGSTYSFNSIPYSFPFIRLPDLYLYYAEALVESVADGAAPPNDAFVYVDKVRERAGLSGVKATWDQAASMRKGLYNTKEGMREIIRRERTIELCFEGKRGEDARRWRVAHELFNDPIRGWNGIGPYNSVTSPSALTDANYYLVTDHYTRSAGYTIKDYLWPIKADNINVNPNLKQNPGW
jgi:hypothetical protein